MNSETGPLTWLHIGDLHITDATGQNLQDFRRLVALVSGLPHGALDFVVLPGDNADDGTTEQFQLVRDAVAPLRLPLHILPGDQDFKSGSLEAFHRDLGAKRLPYAVTVNDRHCLFLDAVSNGKGFGLDQAQLDWMERELAAAETAVVYMNTYPADLQAGAERLRTLLANPKVLCVDIGYTHDNEWVNDGNTIFMATRSTGQTEEGPPGFSIAAIDGGCVSWRFKPLDRAWPFVLVTQPADRRLVTTPNQIAGEAFFVRATVIGDAPIVAVEFSVAGSEWIGMRPDGQPAIWRTPNAVSGENIRVRVRDALERTDEDRIERPTSGWTPFRRAGDGSDRDRVGAWPEKGILGTQLGPNRNGRQW